MMGGGTCCHDLLSNDKSFRSLAAIMAHMALTRCITISSGSSNSSKPQQHTSHLRLRSAPASRTASQHKRHACHSTLYSCGAKACSDHGTGAAPLLLAKVWAQQLQLQWGPWLCPGLLRGMRGPLAPLRLDGLADRGVWKHLASCLADVCPQARSTASASPAVPGVDFGRWPAPLQGFSARHTGPR